MVDNNISETFNGYILNAREKYVMHMLEEIRISLMVRQVKKMTDIDKVEDTLCPLIRKKLDKLSADSKHCMPYPALGGKFEIHIEGDKFVVHVENRTCTCRVWQTVGIPCLHAIAAIEFMEHDPASYVNEYYTIEQYKQAYSFGLEPLNGERLWPQVEGYVVKPPSIRKMPGRPKLKRKRAAHEVDPVNPNKLRRHGQKITCKNCGQVGHNSRGCKNKTVVKVPKDKGKPGRPRTRSNPNEAGASNTEDREGTS
ncbi:uncharacterized protein LOC131022996 [Salvia miltiorrhiza]|uniref:uncharacterized protein LOC131022996 n=1 Tax=Salvia miltiorrhiza TaxID=226208 RepID=UPI0025ABC79C|nr:uncharacterized protein LOC131022996 [Salvia miltiorrhiza]